MPASEISVAELAGHLADGAPLVDVRQPGEYVSGHIPGALLVPLNELPERISELPGGRPLYIVCRSGSRSMVAAEFLNERGIDSVNVAGGTLAWLEAGQDLIAGSQPS
jgi:rhodanese-related sulfurtransferase